MANMEIVTISSDEGFTTVSHKKRKAPVVVEEGTSCKKVLATVTPMSTDKARHREYPSCYRGDFRVFMMPGKSELNLVAITASLHKSYPAVTDVFRVRTNRIRITVSDRMQANAIAADNAEVLQYIAN